MGISIGLRMVARGNGVEAAVFAPPFRLLPAAPGGIWKTSTCASTPPMSLFGLGSHSWPVWWSRRNRAEGFQSLVWNSFPGCEFAFQDGLRTFPKLGESQTGMKAP